MAHLRFKYALDEEELTACTRVLLQKVGQNSSPVLIECDIIQVQRLSLLMDVNSVECATDVGLVGIHARLQSAQPSQLIAEDITKRHS